MTLTDARQIFGYPLWMVGGVSLLLIFAARYRVTRCIGDKVAAALGACIGVSSLVGWLTLFMRQDGAKVPPHEWAVVYTLIQITVGGVYVALALWLLAGAWKHRER